MKMERFGQIGGGLLVVAGFLHMAGVLIYGWNPDMEMLIPIGAVYISLGAFAAWGKKWAQWLGAIVSGLGLIAAVQIAPIADIPAYLMRAYIILDIAVIACLAMTIQHRLNLPAKQG
jgi:hypothetical protein